MNYVAYFTRRRIYRYGMLIFGILFILILLITFYGQYAGTFVIEVDDDAYDRGIILSVEKTFQNPTPSLLSDPAVNVRDITYSWLNIDKAVNTDGNYKDEYYDYIAYTFYIKNTGTETSDVLAFLDIDSVTNNVDKAMRVLIIEDGVNKTMYMKPDDVVIDYPMPEVVETIEFVDDTRVFLRRINALRPGQIKKYTVLVWLEGHDPDCTVDIMSGRIKMHMSFSIDKVYDEEEE